jgi:hypothetical protein
MVAKFPLGQVVATPGAMNALHRAGQAPAFFVQKHQSGDWGEVCPGDAKLNDEALQEGGRLLSSYSTLRGEAIWIITEFDRSVTTLLLPSDY